MALFGGAGSGSAEILLAVHQIADFEGCPLYLLLADNPNNLIDGIRICLKDGSLLVIADEELGRFLELIAHAMRGVIQEMVPSTLLPSIARHRILI